MDSTEEDLRRTKRKGTIPVSACFSGHQHFRKAEVYVLDFGAALRDYDIFHFDVPVSYS